MISNIDYKILCLTILILTIFLFLPSIWKVDGGILLGYPISYLTIYDTISNMKSNDSILYYIKIDVLTLIINIGIIYKAIKTIINKVRE